MITTKMAFGSPVEIVISIGMMLFMMLFRNINMYDNNICIRTVLFGSITFWNEIYDKYIKNMREETEREREKVRQKEKRRKIVQRGKKGWIKSQREKDVIKRRKEGMKEKFQ